MRPGTLVSYKTALKRLKSAMGNIKLQDLRPRDVNNAITRLANDGLAKKTIAVSLHVLHNALDYAVYPCELILSNPAHYIKIPKNAPQNVVPRVVIDHKKLTEILTAFPFGHSYHVPILIAYHTGMRLGEVLGLDWECVDLKQGKIGIIRQLLHTTANGSYFGEPKTATSKRTILIDNRLVALLKKWKVQQTKNEVAVGKMYVYSYEGEKGALWQIPKGQGVPDGLVRRAIVCTHDNGAPISRYGISDALQRLGVNFHSLRHTHATKLMENLAIAKDVAARLGHSDTTITQNLYTHDTEEMQKNTLAVFEQILAEK